MLLAIEAFLSRKFYLHLGYGNKKWALGIVIDAQCPIDLAYSVLKLKILVSTHGLERLEAWYNYLVILFS